MFGIARLNDEEKAAHDLKNKCKVLEGKIQKETALRAESLAKAKAYNEELAELKGAGNDAL